MLPGKMPTMAKQYTVAHQFEREPCHILSWTGRTAEAYVLKSTDVLQGEMPPTAKQYMEAVAARLLIRNLHLALPSLLPRLTNYVHR